MPKATYTIGRLFHEGEITQKQVSQVRKLLRQLHPDRKDEPITMQNFVRYAHENRLVVARTSGGTIVGMATGCRRAWFGGYVVDIRDVVVDARYRRRGIARGLLQDLIKWGRRLGYVELKLTSSDSHAAAHPLYESLGFQRTGTTNKFSFHF